MKPDAVILVFWILSLSMDHLKIFIEFVIILLLFYVFGYQACGILASWPRMEPTPSALEGEVLTTGLTEKS